MDAVGARPFRRRRRPSRIPVTRGQRANERLLQRSEMKDATRKNRGQRSGDDAQELRVVEISFNPGPDAQDRLRRLFTILLEYAARDGTAAPEQFSPSDEGGEGEC